MAVAFTARERLVAYGRSRPRYWWISANRCASIPRIRQPSRTGQRPGEARARLTKPSPITTKRFDSTRRIPSCTFPARSYGVPKAIMTVIDGYDEAIRLDPVCLGLLPSSLCLEASVTSTKRLPICRQRCGSIRNMRRRIGSWGGCGPPCPTQPIAMDRRRLNTASRLRGFAIGWENWGLDRHCCRRLCRGRQF